MYVISGFHRRIDDWRGTLLQVLGRDLFTFLLSEAPVARDSLIDTPLLAEIAATLVASTFYA
jgi:hypothetical protein